MRKESLVRITALRVYLDQPLSGDTMSFRPSAHTSFSANEQNGLTRRTVLFGGPDRR